LEFYCLPVTPNTLKLLVVYLQLCKWCVSWELELVFLSIQFLLWTIKWAPKSWSCWMRNKLSCWTLDGFKNLVISKLENQAHELTCFWWVGLAFFQSDLDPFNYIYLPFSLIRLPSLMSWFGSFSIWNFETWVNFGVFLKLKASLNLWNQRKSEFLANLTWLSFNLIRLFFNLIYLPFSLIRNLL